MPANVPQAVCVCVCVLLTVCSYGWFHLFAFLASTGMWPSSCWDWIMQERLQLCKAFKEVCIWIICRFFMDLWCNCTFYFCTFFVCFCRRSPGCNTDCGIYQDWDEARQIPSDDLRLGWWEKNPRHLEELLHNVSWCGVCGGLHRHRQDPWDKGNLSRGPRSPVHLWEACASVRHTRSLCLLTLNIWNLLNQNSSRSNFLNIGTLWFGSQSMFLLMQNIAVSNQFED